MAKKILLADDSLTIQKVVELTFSDSEYDLICVSNGQRALEKAAEMPPDLILADAVMPEKNGYEVCESIKSNPTTSRIPVILLSGTFEPFDRDRAERLGCDAIVSKPFDSQQLLRQVEALLSRPAGEALSNATVAIPSMTAPAAVPPPPPTPPLSRPPAEAGFSSEDFTGAIRTPAAIAGGADLFEEEYGHGDVETAIAAFEKAHPEFAHVDESATDSAMAAEPGGNNGTGEDAETAWADTSESTAVKPDAGTARQGLADWLRDDRATVAAPVEAPAPARAPAPPPAPFWVPREPEPDLQPIPFAADDSMTRRPAPSSEPVRADEGPTMQIPLAADYAAMVRPHPDDDEREEPPAPLHFPAPTPAPDAVAPLDASAEDRTAEIPIAETRALFEAPAPVPPAEPEPEGVSASTPSALDEPAPVPPEIEELASTTSIGQLKEMLSSVSRSGGAAALSDDEIDRLASRVVERLSDKIVREIAWEVIPDVAELVIKQRIKELESGVE
ncbi:MAG TPA: response regulator [Thermoanaerobaculia bacterium]|jgi:CheY-like chemotaxis protein|nr:response regulator [Thermoanaerobaculia bacterium]